MSDANREVERQISIEVQKEEVVEHPSLVEARKSMTSAGVEDSVNNGELPDKSRAAKNASASAIFPVSLMIERTSALPNKEDRVWDPKKIFVTREFVETIVAPKSARLDPYLHPVRWILASLITRDVVIISPSTRSG